MTQTLKENHVETTGLLKKMDGSITNMTGSINNMTGSINNMASSQRDIITILKRIDSKMKPDS